MTKICTTLAGVCIGYYVVNVYIIVFLIILTAKQTAPVAPRLVIEDVEKRRRIIRSTHDGSHLGLNRTNDMVASKYYWPGLFTDVKTCKLGIHNTIIIITLM